MRGSRRRGGWPTARPGPPIRTRALAPTSRNERTFLAWLRTGMTLVALGVAAAQFLTEPETGGHADPGPLHACPQHGRGPGGDRPVALPRRTWTNLDRDVHAGADLCYRHLDHRPRGRRARHRRRVAAAPSLTSFPHRLTDQIHLVVLLRVL